ncbi:hypothetical protein [Neoactinobaculum massilliense]|uniref:hypothetical protein n=1 Tax=Neoactinobaculum massilliense TaxID=2364794 RepID=UPI000F53DE7C|nr:hypothetical protein [Neoactinobaculum massilliense]
MTVLLCLEGELEVAVLQGLTAAEIQVARRCADTVELLATAAAGLGRVAVVARLDVASAGALRRYGVRILGVGVAPGPAYDAVATPVPTEIVAEVRALGAQNEPGGSGSPVDGELGGWARVAVRRVRTAVRAVCPAVAQSIRLVAHRPLRQWL